MEKSPVTRLIWDAEDYSRSSRFQKQSGRELIAMLELRGDEKVLDLGCGDGKLAVEIAALVPRGYVCGVDASEEMIRFARENYPGDSFPNVRWEVMDAAALTFEDEFDVVFSNAALHWISDHRPVLAGIRKSLKPGGRLFINMGGRGSNFGFVEVLGQVIGKDEWRGFFRDFNFSFGFHGPEDYESWLRQAGLEPKSVELVSRDMAFEGEQEVAAWLRTTWLPFTQKIPEDRRSRFVDEMVAGYVSRYPAGGDGLIHVESVRLRVRAVKPA